MALRSSEEDKGTGSADEWMYLMAAEEKTSIAAGVFESAVGHYVAGRLEEAKDLFEDIAEKDPTDLVAAVYMRLIKPPQNAMAPRPKSSHFAPVHPVPEEVVESVG